MAANTFEENKTAAVGYLERFGEEPLGHLIDGALVPSTSGETFSNVSPIDGSHLGDVAAGDAADIDLAAKAADAAFAEWGQLQGVERRRILHAVADKIEERAHQIAVTESVDTCLLYTSPSPRDKRQSRMPSSA